MKRDAYRNNLVFESEVAYPLDLIASLSIDNENGWMEPLRLVGDKLYGVISKKYLFCVDVKTKKILWDKDNDIDKVRCPIDGDDNFLFLDINNHATCLSSDSGKEIWKASERGIILASTARGLICRDALRKPEVIIYRSKETGEEIWRLSEGVHGYLNNVAADEEFVILEGGEGIHVCLEKSGEVLWNYSYENLLKQYHPGIKMGEYSFHSLGPLVDGVFYAGIEQVGALFAINVATGEPIWIYELGENISPDKIIYYRDKIYFSVWQGAGFKNYLTCLDASSGKLVFKTTENFTPEGGRRPIISNNYIIVAQGDYISFFDLDTREFVWRYKQKHKKNIASPFPSLIFVYKDQLISYNYNAKEIYWFQSK